MISGEVVAGLPKTQQRPRRAIFGIARRTCSYLTPRSGCEFVHARPLPASQRKPPKPQGLIRSADFGRQSSLLPVLLDTPTLSELLRLLEERLRQVEVYGAGGCPTCHDAELRGAIARIRALAANT
jgi:hypothetical protein